MVHKQVIIRVNTECDGGIAPLVQALNELDGVITLDSCERGVLGEGYVFFTCGHKWQDIARLLQTISSALSKDNLDCGYTLRIEWFGSNEWPRAQIVVLPEHVTTLADHIRALSGEINARMCRSTGGRSCRGPHS